MDYLGMSRQVHLRWSCATAGRVRPRLASRFCQLAAERPWATEPWRQPSDQGPVPPEAILLIFDGFIWV